MQHADYAALYQSNQQLWLLRYQGVNDTSRSISIDTDTMLLGSQPAPSGGAESWYDDTDT